MIACVKVAGFEFSEEVAKNFTNGARKVLRRLRSHGVACFQSDDVPQDYETIQALREASKEGYFDMYSQPNGYVHCLVCMKTHEIRI